MYEVFHDFFLVSFDSYNEDWIDWFRFIFIDFCY